MDSPVLMRDTRPNVARSGEWGRVIGVEHDRRPEVGAAPGSRKGVPCFIVEYIDGFQYAWRIVNDEAQYEFK